jgi:hypothetical protein
MRPFCSVTICPAFFVALFLSTGVGVTSTIICLLGLPVLLPDYWMIIICGRRGSVTPEHVPLARLKFCTAKLLPSLHSPEARNHPSLVWVDLQCR